MVSENYGTRVIDRAKAFHSGREEVLDILGRKCAGCGSEEDVEIHHRLPHWLWRFVGETDEGVFSTKFIDYYEVVCSECHSERHKFINENLFQGFRSHYTFQIRWKRTYRRINSTNFTYVMCVNEKGWCSLGFPSGYQRKLRDLPPPFQVEDSDE